MSFFTKNFLPIFFSFFLTAGIVCGTAPETFARGGGGHGGGGHSGGSVSVSGYSRSNGTYVSGYNRSSPSSHNSGNTSSSYGSSYGSSYYSGGYHVGSGHSGHSSKTSRLGVSNHYLSSQSHYSGGTYKSGYAKVERSETAKRQFLRQQGLSRIPAGYHIDHVIPLSQGGSDTPSNMQLLSVEAHHQKTAAERRHY